MVLPSGLLLWHRHPRSGYICSHRPPCRWVRGKRQAGTPAATCHKKTPWVLPFWPRYLAALSLTVWLASVAGAATVTKPSTTRVVDFRYAPLTWHSALGLPEDWHKPMADDRGALLYDFGPGPYTQPLTVVEAGVAQGTLTRTGQHWTDNVVPLLSTELTGATTHVTITTLAIPPAEPAGSDARFARYERLDGISGALGWASPSAPAAPEFRNVAWGVNRALRYRVRVEPGAAKRVVLGFCESYKPRLNERVADLRIEGAPAQVADLALTAARSAPQVFVFEARDTDLDGWLNVAVLAPAGSDPNTTLALIAVYAAGAKFTRDNLIAGGTASGDNAELRIDCGAESRQLSPRADRLHARFEGNAAPVLRVRTHRDLTVGENHTFLDGGAPFVVTQPQPTTAVLTAGVWLLEFPAGTREIAATVFSGRVTPEFAATASALATGEAQTLSRQRWKTANQPPGRIQVADPAIQALIETSQRIVYQGRKLINGRGQFDSSFTLYRGLWAGDAVHLVELAAQLGDTRWARETLETLLSFQNENGLIDEMPPLRLNRTTAAFLWAVGREAN